MYNLPKPYLSYSAWQLWKSDKTRFRKKYYENDPSAEIMTPEVLFGKTIAKRLEDGEHIEGVIKYSEREFRILVEIDPGLKVLGYFDGFEPDDLSIMEYKTGRLSNKGVEPWSDLKVMRHKQLVFYSLLTLLEFGKYNPKIKLQWLETEFTEPLRYKGQIVEDGRDKLRLTGRVETYEREIKDCEIEKLKEEILLAGKEISEDYTLWKKNQLKEVF